MNYESEIVQITEGVFQSMLSFGLERSATPGPDQLPQPSMIGSVHIAGAFRGAVVIECTAAFTRKATAVMFGMAEAEVGSTEMADALGELTNMIGGNVKALIPGECQLSLPTVVEGLQLKIAVPGNRVRTTLFFRSEGEPLKVVLLVRDET